MDLRRQAGNLWLLLTAVGLLSSCEKDHLLDCFKGTGKEETESRALPAFNKIYIYNNMDVEIFPGHAFNIEVTAGSRLIGSVTTEVKDSVLYIRNENKCNWVRSFKNEFRAKVWLPDMVELNAYGSGDITLKDTIRTPDFVYNNWQATGNVVMLFNTVSAHPNIHTGSANITMHGHVGVFFLYNNAQGLVDGRDMDCDITYTTNSGTNNHYVNAKDELVAKITYIGDIYYTGNPSKITREGEGTGKIIKLN